MHNTESVSFDYVHYIGGRMAEYIANSTRNFWYGLQSFWLAQLLAGLIQKTLLISLVLVPAFPIGLVFTGYRHPASDAVWYGLSPAFLVGVIVFALALPDKYKEFSFAKFFVASVAYLIFMTIGLTLG
jgi:hypothetical protein